MNEPAQIPSRTNESEPGKRTLLSMLAAFAALTVCVVLFSLGARVLRTEPRPQHHQAPSPAASTPPPQEQTDPRIVAYLGPIATERRFDSWRITRIDPLQFGRMTLEVEGEGAGRFVVDVHALNTNGPPPIAKTAKVALYLRTNQRGGQTPPAFIDACIALARALEAREAAGHEPPPLESLMPK